MVIYHALIQYCTHIYKLLQCAHFVPNEEHSIIHRSIQLMCQAIDDQKKATVDPSDGDFLEIVHFVQSGS